jgi:hypothetical protein
VTDKLIGKTASNRKYRRLIRRCCAWLDEEAKPYGADHFAALSEAQRE